MSQKMSEKQCRLLISYNLYDIFREHLIHVFSFSLTLCPGGSKSLYILFVQLLGSVGAAGN